LSHKAGSNGVNRSAKYATAIVVAHLLVNIVHGRAHGELRVGLAPPASIFVIMVVLISFDRNGAPLDNSETARVHSSFGFDVRIIAIWSVPPFSGR
jgi:hypothetical protein